MSHRKAIPFPLSIFFFFFFTPLHSQPPEISARSLDAVLQDYAFRAVQVRPKTGVVFDAELPVEFTGIKASAMRLRTGSLRTRGVRSYREFQIPLGIVEQPYSKRIVLVYHNLGNFSSRFYPLPGLTYLAPTLGLLAYDASNLSATGLPELEIRASGEPILVHFPDVVYERNDTSFPKCVYFDLDGSLQFNQLLPGNVCPMVKQGHFSVVVESTAPSPTPSPSPSPSAEDHNSDSGQRRDKSKTGKIVGSLIGVLVFLAVIFVVVWKIKKLEDSEEERKKEKQETTEWRNERGEALRMTSFGSIKAPFAMVTRTQPVLEERYVP